MSVNENKENLLKLQNRVSKIVDEMAVMRNNLDTFRTAVTQDVQNIVRTIQDRHNTDTKE